MAQSSPDRWEAVVRAVEDGFFTGDRQAPSQAGQFTFTFVDGIPALTQFFRVHVDVKDLATSSVEIWVVLTAIGTWDRKVAPGEYTLDEAKLGAVRSALLVQFPDATMCFTTEDRQGFSRVIGKAEDSIAIAAAVSAVKYRAGWDESDPITVEIADARFAVSIAPSPEIYRAVVQRV